MSPDNAASAFVFLATLLLGACGGSSSGIPSVAIDDGDVSGIPEHGEFDNDDNTLPTLNFSIAEDGVLNGLFFDSQTETGAEPAAESENGGSSVAFLVLSLPSSGLLTLGADGARFVYEPEANFNGTDRFTYTAPDNSDIDVVINVEPVPDAPSLNLDISAIAEQGRRYEAQLTAQDPDIDDVLFYSVENMPDWLALDAASGFLSGVPTQSEVGSISNLRIVVTDTAGLTDQVEDFELEVVEINDAPGLNITQVPRELFGLDSVSFDVFPRDAENNDVIISVGSHEAFESSVEGSLISLQMNDILRQYSSELVITARDELGATTREVIPIELFPRTASGNGITVSGYKAGRGIHIVVLGDAYTSDQLPSFRRHVDDFLENIRSDDGIAEHLGALNIHMIETVSKDTGADDGETLDNSDTAFNSTYNCRSIPRLVCADTLALYEATLVEYPDVDQIVLLVNDLRYGGSGNSGGRVAMTSAYFPEIALHEMGHSLADLADEYVDPQILENIGSTAFEEGRFANVSTLSDPQKVPWSHWIDQTAALPQTANDEGVGVFEGGYYRSRGVYRPTFDSRMRSYNSPFGAVNTEQWLLRLYTLTEGIRELDPAVHTLPATVGETLTFSIDPVFGMDVQEISWSLNGESLLASGDTQVVLPTNGDSPTIEGGATSESVLDLSSEIALEASSNEVMSRLNLVLPQGQFDLSVTVSDISGKIRVSPPHAGIFTWTWAIDVQ